jgi:hypothetical protein
MCPWFSCPAFQQRVMPPSTGDGANLFQRPGYYFRDGASAGLLKLFKIDP